MPLIALDRRRAERAASRRLALLALAVAGCAGSPGDPGSSPDGGAVGGADAAVGADGGAGPSYAWRLPPGFPEPVVPANNRMSEEKVELGRRLFYDVRLSGNQTASCGSCHEQARAFTDGRGRAVGSTGEVHPRGAMSLANVAYLSRFGWANPLLIELEQQAVVPMFGAEPVELGMGGREDELLDRLGADADYPAAFAAAFAEDLAPITVANVVKAIASFERTLLSGSSPYDRRVAGDDGAISAAAARGEALFFSERLECFHCHAGFNFQDSGRWVGKPFTEARFHNTGLYNVGGTGAYPAPNTGVHAITGRASDMGRFRAPTLRNVAVTAPYMHDGSVADLADAVAHYAAGGRTIASGPSAGDGSQSPYKSNLVLGFELSEGERADLLAFLTSLTDEEFLADPRFADPNSAGTEEKSN